MTGDPRNRTLVKKDSGKFDSLIKFNKEGGVIVKISCGRAAKNKDPICE